MVSISGNPYIGRKLAFSSGLRIRNDLFRVADPDPDPTLEKKKVGRFNIFTLKEGGEGTYR